MGGWLPVRGHSFIEGILRRNQPFFFMEVTPDGLHDDNLEDFSGILNKLKNYLLEYYVPVQQPKDAELHFSTTELWQQLLKLFPNESILTQELVAQWMHVGGFTFYDYGEMRLEWMMKKASTQPFSPSTSSGGEGTTL